MASQQQQRAAKELELLAQEIDLLKNAKNDVDYEDQGRKTVAALMPISGQNARPFPLQIPAKRTLKGHFAKIYALHWAPDNQKLVSASQDGKMIVWNAHTTQKIHMIPLRSAWVMTCAYSPSGDKVACGGLDNTCSIYSLSDPNISNVGAPPLVELEHQGYLSCCRFLGSDQHMVTSCGDFSCSLWDTSQNVEVKKFEGHSADVMSVAVNPETGTSGVFVSGACDCSAKVWDMRLPEPCIRTFTDHLYDINAVAYFPDKMAFATGSDDSTCKFYDLRSNCLLNTFSLRPPPIQTGPGVTSLDFSSSGRFLFAGYECQQNQPEPGIIVFDVLRNEVLQRIGQLEGNLREGRMFGGGHGQRVSCVAVTSDGMGLATGSWDTYIKIWA
eukprot:gnl/Hemi2/2760_TR972_c0_g1_i1.p1 gnl/Hemi2/2760_TR972_c0_g1~~gnl/Hemi2/2760_TR972_c0_g1_i1.p1  ORF type:complete len:385 (-),score=61.24 gnl/Hemi2/2760_TR972_c0_g1_i1:251-1405(-)